MSEARTRAPGRVHEATSLQNPIVKSIRALANKRDRDESGLFLAEGLKLAIEALDAGWRIRTLVFAKTALGNPLLEKTAARARAAGGDLLEVSGKVLEAVTRRENPQNVVAVVEQRWTPLEKLGAGEGDVVVALDRVRDPGNLGTVIRTADAVGAKGVVLVGESTDAFGLEAVRATMGSIFAVPLFRAGEKAFLDWRRGFGGLVVGTHLRGDTDYRKIPAKNRPVLLLMGNESQGLPDSLSNACDVLARIPQAGRADSLNLAVATAVMLFELRRDRLTLEGA
ncbi:MAG TPA: RNA methyltransferase [Mesorhizobium sp.]|nr:RNA methyltransferase [Mesorhizobium sp.]